MSKMSAVSRFTSEDLAKFLKSKAFQDEVIERFKGSEVDGETFIKLTRDDLKELFPSSFPTRKKIWDFLEDLRSESYPLDSNMDGNLDDEAAGIFVSPPTKRPRSSPLSSASNSPNPFEIYTVSSEDGKSSKHGSFDKAESVGSLSSESSAVSCFGPTQKTRHGSASKAGSVSSVSSGASSRSGGSTEKVVDLEEEFKFPVPEDLRSSTKYPDEKTLRRFIRDATACLQAITGENTTNAELITASQKICDTVPILKDPRPSSFSSFKKFPYWATVLFLMKRRIQNVKGYQKRKDNLDKKTGEKQIASVFDDKALEEMYALLLREVKSKKTNLSAVKEIQEKTFEHRKKIIQEQSKKSTVESIVSKYPFFKEQECTLLHELELHCKERGGRCTTSEQFCENWKDVASKLRDFLKKEDLLEDENPNPTADEICGAVMEHTQHLDEKCTIPLCNIIFKPTSDVDAFIKKHTKTDQPTLWFALDDDGLLDQSFLVIDKKVFMELQKPVSCVTSLMVLVASYFAFNLCYTQCQENIFLFIEEFVLGIIPNKKTVKYRKMCQKLI